MKLSVIRFLVIAAGVADGRRLRRRSVALVTSKLGSAQDWSGRERVLVVGASGKLGSTIFGLLQRCAPNNIFSGLGDPRGLIGTPRGAKALNSHLGGAFVLAHAGESLMALVDWGDNASLANAMQGCGCAVIATRFESSWAGEVSLGFGGGDGGESGAHAARFELLVRTAAETDGLRNLVVVETPGTTLQEREAALALILCQTTGVSGILSLEGVTYLCPGGDGPLIFDPNWTFQRGIPTSAGGISVRLGELSGSFLASPSLLEGPKAQVTLEDVAACVVQSIQSLPWEAAKCVLVECTVGSNMAVLSKAGDEPAQVWVVGSGRIEDAFAGAVAASSQ